MITKVELINAQEVINNMLETLQHQLKPNALKVVADEVRYLLHGLAGTLKQYEKGVLERADESALTSIGSGLTQAFNDMEKDFESYKQKWVQPSAIESSPDQYIEDSKIIYQAIYKFLNQEKSQLLPLL